MFENLSLESEERRTNAPALRVDEVSPEVAELVSAAWGRQNEVDEGKSLGHVVEIGDKNVVERFHAEARQACKDHEPRLKYRRLTRVGDSKDEGHAYFSVSAWPTEADGMPEDEKPDTADEKPPTRRRTAK